MIYIKIVQAFENNENACCVFLDFAKAFDTVNHDILLRKLENYGIRGLALNWFNSYLKNRMQLVNINGIHSNRLEIKCGVPQGSVSIQNWDLTLDNVNDSFKDFHMKLDGAVNRHAPMRKLNPKEIKIKNKPWMTPHIVKQIKLRNKIFERKKDSQKMKIFKSYLSNLEIE